MDLKKQENENNLQYIWRLASAKDAGVINMSWDELANVFNENLGQNLGSSTYRKPYQQGKAYYDDVFSKMESNEVNEELIEQRRLLESLKIQFRDERNAWQKQNYTDARVSQKMDYLEEKLSEMGKLEFDDYSSIYIDGDTDLLVMLTDFHIGQTFDTKFGKYNTDIAQKRLNQLLENVVHIGTRHHAKDVYVSIGGDLISGNIHKSLQVTNRENVIEQIKIAAQLITSFVCELGKYFNEVHITNVSGNHSRCDKKDDAIHDERFDDLIGWIIEQSTKHIRNIHFNHNNIDTGIAEIRIRGKKYISCHGDYDRFAKSGVQGLVMMIGYIPYAVLFGHLHTCATDECSGVKMIRGGSLAGSGDQYTIEKRLSGNPSQMVCVCSENGVDAYYPVELD